MQYVCAVWTHADSVGKWSALFCSKLQDNHVCVHAKNFNCGSKTADQALEISAKHDNVWMGRHRSLGSFAYESVNNHVDACSEAIVLFRHLATRQSPKLSHQ